MCRFTAAIIDEVLGFQRRNPSSRPYFVSPFFIERPEQVRTRWLELLMCAPKPGLLLELVFFWQLCCYLKLDETIYDE